MNEAGRNWRKAFVAAAISVLLLVAIYLFYVFDPEETPFFPQCPFLLTTGYECPGCGSQRAIRSMLHLDFQSAFSYNSLILFLIPYILLGLYLEMLNGKKRFPNMEKLFFGKWSAIVVLVVILIYWIGRNGKL